MPVRKVVTGKWVCHTDNDCLAHSHADSVCVTPSLENQTRFIRVVHLPNMHMLFVGYPPHLQYAGTLFTFGAAARLDAIQKTVEAGSSFSVRVNCSASCIRLLAVSLTSFVPRFRFLHLDLPIFLETFCKYPSNAEQPGRI